MVGRRFDTVVGPVAHGGHCVARVEVPGEDRPRVVFVRHALPEERVVVEITEGAAKDSFWRGDAVEVREPSVARVDPPCEYAHPGGCGGCDFQHVDLAEQRRLKATVVAEQVRRLAGLEWPVEVEAVPGDDAGLAWRTRQAYVDLGPDEDGEPRIGMRKHRSHDVIEIDRCMLEAESGPRTTVRGVDFEVAEAGFWQVHPGAPEALVDAVLAALDAQPGDRVLDLYAGVGLFARFLGDAVGEQGQVTAVEAEVEAAELCQANVPGAVVHAAPVASFLKPGSALAPTAVDVVVLDPPRSGAKRDVVEGICALSPRAVAYVACDPAALGRDLAYFAESGYQLTDLRSFDLFPMTHHVECVATLQRVEPSDSISTSR